MRKPIKVNVSGEHRARVSDELRQLKLMSKGLRSKAMRALMERHAARTLEAKPVLPAKTASSVAA
jgi:hypothetical protein